MCCVIWTIFEKRVRGKEQIYANFLVQHKRRRGCRRQTPMPGVDMMTGKGFLDERENEIIFWKAVQIRFKGFRLFQHTLNAVQTE